jgi:hypothetical protein
MFSLQNPTPLRPANSVQLCLVPSSLRRLTHNNGYRRSLYLLKSIDHRVPCCYAVAPFFSSTPCCHQMLSFAGVALGCPFTPFSSTSEGEKCLISHTFGTDTIFRYDCKASRWRAECIQ